MLDRPPSGLALARLRGFVTALVVMHHSVIAYCVNSRFNRAHYLWGAPIVDTANWQGFDILVRFNDSYFMPLMFFLSGLFVWSSWRRKGSRAFLAGRMLRLGLPFVLSSVILMPLAFYASFRLTGADIGYLDYWKNCFAIDQWPSGPPWFIWVLLALDGAAVMSIALWTGFPDWLDRLAWRASHAPCRFFATLFLFSGGACLAMLLLFGPERWLVLGPFSIWASRSPFYLLYFGAGLALGKRGVQNGVLAGSLAQRWPLWIVAGWSSFVLLLAVEGLRAGIDDPRQMLLLGGAWAAALALCSVSVGTMMLALFLRFAQKPSWLFDRFGEDAYGVFLLHYVFVLWLQYLLLDAAWPALFKAGAVFFGALACSWALIRALRRLPLVARVL